MTKICIEVVATAHGLKPWAVVACLNDAEISEIATETKEQAEKLASDLFRNFKILASSQSRVGAHFEANDP